MNISRREVIGKVGFLDIHGGKEHYDDLIENLSKKNEIVPINIHETSDAVEATVRKCNIIVTYSEYTPDFVVAITIAKELSKPIILLMDGILEWRNWFNRPFGENDLAYLPPIHPFLAPSLCDYIFTHGLWQSILLNAFGNIGKTILTGSFRLDKFSHKVQHISNKKEKKLLIATARSPAFCENQLNTLLDFLKSLNSYLQKQEIEIRWRVSEEIAQILGVKRSITSLVDDIHWSSACASLPSTLCLESMLAGLPTAVLNPFTDPLLIKSAWTINSPSDYMMINELFNPLPAKLRYQKVLLEFSCLCDGKSLTRASNAIENIISNQSMTADTINYKKLFPINVSDQHSENLFQPNYDIPSFQKNYSSAIIKHLKSKIATLENDLRQADKD